MINRFLTVIGLLFFLYGCEPDTDIIVANPEAALLIFPHNNEECTTGISISDTESEVEFRWENATATDQYTLEITNLTNNSVEQIVTQNTGVTVAILKGTPYSWSVSSSNRVSDVIVKSETWQFYNSGSLLSFPPFPTQQVAPLSGQTVVVNSSNQVQLQWEGTDLDNDIVQYQIYLSEQNPPESLVQTVDGNTNAVSVVVATNTVYYWRIVTTDENGNTSDSGVIDFRVSD